MERFDTEHKNRLGRLLGITGKMAKRRLSRNLAREGFALTAEQAILLWHLHIDEGVTQKAIAEHFDHDRVGITRWVDGLEEQNLDIRVPDKSDRRQKLVYLTEQGKKRCIEIEPVFKLTMAQAVKGVDDNDLEICRAVLRAICANLGDVS